MTNEVLLPDPDEQLLKRFLVGDVTAEERDLIEQRFIDDSAYFERLCALEDEMLLALVRGELPEPWSGRFGAAVEASEARRRRVHEMREIARVVEQTGAPRASQPMTRTGAVKRGAWWLSRWPVAAGIILSGALTGWWLLRQGSPGPAGTSSQPSHPSVVSAVPTFVLLPGPTRTEATPPNALRIPANAREVRLVAMLPADSRRAVYARLRRVGGDPLGVSDSTQTRVTGQDVEVSWTVPAEVLVPGDYLLTFEMDSNGGTREAIASRFFSIIR